MLDEPAAEPASSTESVRSRASYSNSATKEDKLLDEPLLENEDEDEITLLFELLLLEEVTELDFTELEVAARELLKPIALLTALLELDKLVFELAAGTDEGCVIELCTEAWVMEL
jgi:hypothetical protein